MNDRETCGGQASIQVAGKRVLSGGFRTVPQGGFRAGISLFVSALRLPHADLYDIVQEDLVLGTCSWLSARLSSL